MAEGRDLEDLQLEDLQEAISQVRRAPAGLMRPRLRHMYTHTHAHTQPHAHTPWVCLALCVVARLSASV